MEEGKYSLRIKYTKLQISHAVGMKINELCNNLELHRLLLQSLFYHKNNKQMESVIFRSLQRACCSSSLWEFPTMIPNQSEPLSLWPAWYLLLSALSLSFFKSLTFKLK